jgi:hypothetical protein
MLLALSFALRLHFIHAFLHLFDAFLHFGLMLLLLLSHLLAAFLLLSHELLTGRASTARIVWKAAWHAWWIRTCASATFHPSVRTELGRCSRRCRALCTRYRCRLSGIRVLFCLYNRHQQQTAGDGTRHQQLQPACTRIICF